MRTARTLKDQTLLSTIRNNTLLEKPLWWDWLQALSRIFELRTAEAAITDEHLLLSNFKAGDENAFKRVFDQNFKKLYLFAFKLLKSKEQAEEVVNDAFLNVWINREKIDSSLPILPYLYTVTRRLTLNALRRVATSQRAIDELWYLIENTSNTTEEAILLHDLQRYTDSRIAVLPPQQQQIFKLSRNEGLNYEQIAEKLNISKNTVRNHLTAALKTLRNQFEGSGF
jgi:RNA polymerase sigma-70 factor (family 1)